MSHLAQITCDSRRICQGRKEGPQQKPPRRERGSVKPPKSGTCAIVPATVAKQNRYQNMTFVTVFDRHDAESMISALKRKGLGNNQAVLKLLVAYPGNIRSTLFKRNLHLDVTNLSKIRILTGDRT
jgi:hypothetical protein